MNDDTTNEHPIQQPEDQVDSVDQPQESPREHTEEDTEEKPAGRSVEVRRNVPLAAAVAVVAGLLTIAFAVRAFGGDAGALDWLALGVMLLVTAAYVVTLIDARAPLMVVDGRGVRLREGAKWQGVAWHEVECLEHLPRRTPLRDGHLLVVGHDDRQLVVPLTLATRVVGSSMPHLSDTLAALADGRADVVEVVPGLHDDHDADDSDDSRDDRGGYAGPAPETRAVPTFADLYSDDDSPAQDFDDSDDTAERPVVDPDQHEAAVAPTPPAPTAWPGSPAHAAAPADAEDTVDLSGETGGTAADLTDTGEIPPVDGPSAQSLAAAPPLPGRTTVLAARVDMAGSPRAEVAPAAATAVAEPDPQETQTVVLEDLALNGAADPVVGNQLAAARERLRLSIDQLSTRTRIRPHVIEAMEVDDFAPCGGDFYARGHLRTLCRVLGIDAGPLVATYDSTYADAPVDPRRIFESELATGHGGSIRSTRGGRNWSVLISAVMGAVLIWSVARLLLGGPAPIGDTPVLNQSGGIARSMNTKGDPVKVVLTAAHGGAKVIVHDATGRTVLNGPLAFGQTANLKAVAPVKVWTSDGSVTASIAGKPAQALGKTGEATTATLVSR